MDYDDHTIYSEEALRSQDGKKVPLTADAGGRVIGEATLKYDPETQTLRAEMRVDDPELAKMLGSNPSSVLFKQGE